MKALVKYDNSYGKLELRELPKPAAGDDGVVVGVRAAGICGSDLQHYQSLHRLPVPVVLGHEFSGTVVETGKNVTGWKLGERVIAETHAYTCGHCDLCRTGSYYLCNERKGLGSSVDGAFAQYVAVPARLLHRIPARMSYEDAAVIQPAADAVHAVFTNSSIIPGDTVVVFGPGPLGLLCAQMSRILGAGQTIVVGLASDKLRMELALNLGVDAVIDAENEDLDGRVAELTQNMGANLVLEVSGARTGYSRAVRILSAKGQLTAIGVPTESLELSLEVLQRREQRIQTSYLSSWPDYERAIRLVNSGRLRVSPMVTHVLPLSDWQDGFDLARTKRACKVLLTPVARRWQKHHASTKRRSANRV